MGAGGSKMWGRTVSWLAPVELRYYVFSALQSHGFLSVPRTSKLLLPQGLTHTILWIWGDLPLRALAELGPSQGIYGSQFNYPLLSPCLTVQTMAAILHTSTLCGQVPWNDAKSCCSSWLARKPRCALAWHTQPFLSLKNTNLNLYS